jgi:hypothetical protein
MSYNISTMGKKNKTYLLQSDFEGFFQATKDNAKNDASSHTSRDRSFHGEGEFAESFDNALTLETKGYNAQAIAQSFDDLSDAFNAEDTNIQMDYNGDIFDTASVIMGELKHWFNEVNEVRRPLVNLMIVPNGNCMVNAENWLRQGSAVAKVAEMIQDKCDVRITACWFNLASLQDNSNTIQMLTLKDYHEDLDFRRLGAVTHPSFFRRLVFGILENGKGDMGGKKNHVSWGYGRSVESWEGLKITKEDFQNHTNCDEVVLMPNAEHFGSMERTIEIIKNTLGKVEAFLGE